MFKLSKGAEYAIRSVLFLAQQPNGKAFFSEEIAKAQDIPSSYLAKVFQALVRKGVLKSMRGTKGGFTLLPPPKSISMYDVIVALEGDIFLNDCMLYNGYCPRDEVCPAHFFWKEIQGKFLADLKKVDFETMANQIKILKKAHKKKNTKKNSQSLPKK